MPIVNNWGHLVWGKDASVTTRISCINREAVSCNTRLLTLWWCPHLVWLFPCPPIVDNFQTNFDTITITWRDAVWITQDRWCHNGYHVGNITQFYKRLPHDDVITYKHFPIPLVGKTHRPLVDSINKMQLIWRFDVFFVVILNTLCNKQLNCWRFASWRSSAINRMKIRTLSSSFQFWETGDASVIYSGSSNVWMIAWWPKYTKPL